MEISTNRRCFRDRGALLDAQIEGDVLFNESIDCELAFCGDVIILVVARLIVYVFIFHAAPEVRPILPRRPRKRDGHAVQTSGGVVIEAISVIPWIKRLVQGFANSSADPNGYPVAHLLRSPVPYFEVSLPRRHLYVVKTLLFLTLSTPVDVLSLPGLPLEHAQTLKEYDRVLPSSLTNATCIPESMIRPTVFEATAVR